MHEVGLMESAVSMAAARAGGRPISRIVLRIGALSGVEPQALWFAFEAVTKGTPAEGAELDVEEVPALAHCPHCDNLFEAEGSQIFVCPKCRRLSGDLRQGRELELRRVELR